MQVSSTTAALMTVAPMLWASNAVVGRLMVGRVPPLTLNALRWLLAALILLPLGFRALRAPRTIARQWPYLLIIGSLGVGETTRCSLHARRRVRTEPRERTRHRVTTTSEVVRGLTLSSVYGHHA